MGKNLIVREIYRVFERAIATQYGDSVSRERIETFLQVTFERNAPLYLILMLTEDKNLMESLFNIQQRFCTSLAAKQLTDKDRRYMKSFYEFLNPYNANASLKPLLKYLLNIQKGEMIQLPMLPDFTKSDAVMGASY
jgi:hypothetical protein